ncbi:MAG TPA: hypothetical protein PL009_06775 [Flavipsychrobacter sp.]|nr:hypothetical protein [Flavipsychrobacter sp.]
MTTSNVKMQSYFERIIICIFLLILTVFATVFYKERIIFTDTVGCIMDMLKKDSLNVTTNRYISIFGELLPFASYKLNSSLRLIVFLYSLNLILIPVLLALLSVYWFKETRTAWSILLFYTIMSARLFYFPISEFQCGLCFLLFYIGLYEYSLKKNSRLNATVFWLLSLFFIPTVVFSHPLSILVLGAWLIFQFFISKKSIVKPLFIVLIAALSYLVKKAFFEVPYDSEKAKTMENFKTFSMAHLDDTLANQFYKALRDDYFLVPLLIVLSIVALIRMKHYISAILLPSIILAFWLLVTVSFKNEPYWYYSEHMYQPLSFFIALATGRLFTICFSKKFSVLILTIVVAVSLNKIYYSHEPMKKRLDWYAGCFELMDKKGIKKTVVGIERIDIGWKMEANWLTMYESLVLSALDNPEHAKTITMVWNEQDSRKATMQGESFITVGIEHWPIKDVPENYFKLSSSHYSVLADIYSDEEIRRLSYQEIGTN